MPLDWLDHVTIWTADVAGMVRFYTEVLGLEEGERPSFDFDGSWLYCDTRAVVHLVESGRPMPDAEPRIEHFAFRASGLAEFLEVLRGNGVGFEIVEVPDVLIKQVHVRDPDGNHIEIAFAPHEAPA